MPPPSPFPYIAFAVLNIYVLKCVNEAVTTPYMDEPFHVPQAQAYCLGDFSSYDPKLTTPPGLYIFTVVFTRLFVMRCRLPILRFTSCLLLLTLPLFFTHLLPLSKPPPRDEPPRTLLQTVPNFEAIALAFFPVMWFFGFLYYTDMGAVACAVATVVFARRRMAIAAALTGAVGMLFRQTNVIWLLYAMSLQVFDILHWQPATTSVTPSESGSAPGDHLVDPSLSLATLAGFAQSMRSLILSGISRTPELVTELWPYLLPFFGFAGFIAWNGGIALGDRANHVPTPHLALPLYFVAFATAFALPVLLTGPLGAIGLAKAVAGKMLGGPRRTVATVVWTGIAMVAIHYFSIAHPFLLSDNRHYTFYLWRRVFLLHPIMPFVFAPGYIACFWVWAVRLGSQSILPLLSLLLCTLLVLIPTPLLEPRYFIIPYLFLRSQLETSPVGVGLECAFYGAVNAVVMTMFMDKPFDGGWGEGMGRLMW